MKEILGATRVYVLCVVIYFAVVHLLTLILMLRELIHFAGLLGFRSDCRMRVQKLVNVTYYLTEVCVNYVLCFLCLRQESELSEYRAGQRKLIRISVFFTLTFLLLKLPATRQVMNCPRRGNDCHSHSDILPEVVHYAITGQLFRGMPKKMVASCVLLLMTVREGGKRCATGYSGL